MNWSLAPEIPVLEKVVRPLVVYLFLLVVFRIAGKRELGQMTPFDLIILLTLSNVLQNAMIGPDNSLGGGLIGAATMVVANNIVARLTFRFPVLGRLVESNPTVLIEDGRILVENLKREAMTRTELDRALREHDLDPAADIPSIERVLLEADGKVTIRLKSRSG